MPIVCPKCNTVRAQDTPAPDWQCPACGVAYAKASANLSAPASAQVNGSAASLPIIHRHSFTPRTPSLMARIPWVKLVLLTALGLSVHHGWQRGMFSGPMTADRVHELAAKSSVDDVVMYSADWCPHCRAARGWLDGNGFKYKLCDIDLNAACKREFEALPPGGGIPYMIVKGTHINKGFHSDKFLAAMAQK
jgi:glutaredoxin